MDSKDTSPNMDSSNENQLSAESNADIEEQVNDLESTPRDIEEMVNQEELDIQTKQVEPDKVDNNVTDQATKPENNSDAVIYILIAVVIILFAIAAILFLKGDNTDDNSTITPTATPITQIQPTIEVISTTEPTVTTEPSVTPTTAAAEYNYLQYSDNYLAFDYPENWQVEVDAGEDIAIFDQYTTTNGVKTLAISDNLSKNYFSISPVYGGDEFHMYNYNPATKVLKDSGGYIGVTPEYPSAKGVEVTKIANTELYTIKIPSLDRATIVGKYDDGSYGSVDYGAIYYEGFLFMIHYDKGELSSNHNGKWVRLNCTGDDDTLDKCINMVHHFFETVEQKFVQKATTVDLTRTVDMYITSRKTRNRKYIYRISYESTSSIRSHTGTDNAATIYGDSMSFQVYKTTSRDPGKYLLGYSNEIVSESSASNSNFSPNEFYYLVQKSSKFGDKRLYYYSTDNLGEEDCGYTDKQKETYGYTGCSNVLYTYGNLPDGLLLKCYYVMGMKEEGLKLCDHIVNTMSIEKVAT